MSDNLQRAIAAIRSGDKETGKQLLAEVIRNNPRNETAWLWMSSVVDSDEHRRTCLERVLAINPHNETARRGLKALTQRQSEEPPRIEKQSQPTPPASSDALQQIKRIDQQTTKKCPYCAETIKAEAVICRYCGRDLRPGQSSQQIAVSQPQPMQVQLPPQRLWSPGVAALLSFFIPGAGQIYKGQIGRGLLFLIIVVAGYAALVVPGLILHLLVIIDATKGNPYAQHTTWQQPGQDKVQTLRLKQSRATLPNYAWIAGAGGLLLVVIACVSFLVAPALLTTPMPSYQATTTTLKDGVVSSLPTKILTLQDFENSPFCTKHQCRERDRWEVKSGGISHSYDIVSSADVSISVVENNGRAMDFALGFYGRENLSLNDLDVIYDLLQSIQTNLLDDSTKDFIRQNVEKDIFQICEGQRTAFGEKQIWVGKVHEQTVWIGESCPE